MNHTYSTSGRPPSGRPLRSRRPKVRASWEHAPSKPPRRGAGVHYGALDLAPRDHYAVRPIEARNDGKLRVIVMGGNEEVGRNMTLLEYGDDIILIDMGIQFAEEHMRGVDGIVPDLSYLKGREHQVRAVIITHMHMDHIGAIPYLMPLLPGVPLFSAPITLALIAKKLEYTPDVKVDMRPIDETTTLALGNFAVSFLGVSHSVPSALAVVVKTPCGIVVHTGDFKVDLQPNDEEGKRNLEGLKALGEKNVLALLSDSTNAVQAGNQLMERDLAHDLGDIVQNAKGRLLFGMISTNVVRLAQIIALAEKYGRHVAVGGLSLKTTLEIAQNLGYISPLPNTLLDISEIKGLPPRKVIAIFPGAQGENNAAFYKLADGELKDMKVVPGDTVVFSSSVIPGNERTVQFLTDKFYRLGANVLNYRTLNIHAGGHAKAADLAEVIKMVKPRYLIPIEGHHAFLHHHAKAAMGSGFPRERIFIADNGQVMEFELDGSGRLTKEKVSTQSIFVDAEALGTVDADTLRERKRLGDEGIVIVHVVLGKDRKVQARADFFGFRSRHLLPKIERDLQQLVHKEATRLASGQAKAIEQLQEKLQEMIEKDTRASPYVSLHVHTGSVTTESGPKGPAAGASRAIPIKVVGKQPPAVQPRGSQGPVAATREVSGLQEQPRGNRRRRSRRNRRGGGGVGRSPSQGETSPPSDDFGPLVI
ncbi:ribonuclease J [Candidatus Uhrbacteria bacterium]|nr:ribonuclease J [Candidatus Uhrbacteria bacterium]